MSTDDVVETEKKPEPKLYPFCLYREAGEEGHPGALKIGMRVPADGLQLAGPVQAATWQEARALLNDDFQLYLRRQAEAVEGTAAQGEGVFRDAHEALTFAFSFTAQSPKTPLSSMLQQREPLGSGRGLSGLDAAAQAGMVLATLRHLSKEQVHVLIARYYNVRLPCQCCGQPRPSPEWDQAVEALSLCPELRDLNKEVRRGLVELCLAKSGRRSTGAGKTVADIVRGNDYSVITIRRRFREMKERFAQVEKSALGWLNQHFDGRGVLKKEA